MGHTRHAVLSRFLGIRFRFALWLSPCGGEEPPFKGRWHSGLQAPNYRAEQRPGRRKKTAQNNSFTQSLFFAVKSKGLQPLVVFRLQLMDAWQPWVVFPLQLMDAWQPWVVFPLQPIDALQPPVVFGKEKKGWSNHPFSFSTSVFASANAVMCTGSNPVTQPPDAPRRAVSPGRNPRSRVQGVPARFNGGDGVLRGFRGRNRNLPLIP